MSSKQVEGLVGLAVDRMIRRSVRKNFHGVWWIPPPAIQSPAVFVPNHHGWYDGYLMYHAVTALGLPTVDWIAEFDAFPLFRCVGGMPFPPDRPQQRAATMRKTIRAMQSDKKSLLLFAEGVLHRPPEVLPFGKSLKLICQKVTDVKIVPVAIRYEMALHERPEAFLCFGEPMSPTEQPEKVRLVVKRLLDECALKVAFSRDEFQCLAPGTRDVNERWDMRRLKVGK